MPLLSVFMFQSRGMEGFSGSSLPLGGVFFSTILDAR